jgi:hypothetical protein
LIEPSLGLEAGDDPFVAMQALAAYLQRAGYVDEIAVRPRSEIEWDYVMLDPAILPGAKRLLAEGAVPAHISTGLMFALLKKRYGLRAEMVDEPEFQTNGLAIERWRLLTADNAGRLEDDLPGGGEAR